MNLSLAVTTDDIHKLHKTFTILGSYTGTLREECSIDNPIIKVQVPEGTAQQANYCAISAGTELPRTYYYFITDKVFVRDGIVELHMECDYLMTFEDEIKELEVTVERNEFDADSYLVDENYKIDAYSNYVTIDFPNGFDTDDDTYILMTVGNGAQTP